MSAIAGALVSAGASLLGGFGKASAQRKRDKANVKAMVHANYMNAVRADAMNAEVRARADAASKIPIVTIREDAGYRDASGVDTDAFLAASARIGINPITMMRSGTLGLFGYTDYGARKSTETVHGAHAMDAALAGQHIAQFEAEQLLSAPPASGMEVFGNALGDGFQTYQGMRSQEIQNAHQLAVVDRQLEGEARIAATRQRGGFGSVPTYVFSGSSSGSSGQAKSGSLASASPGPIPDGYFIGGGLSSFQPNKDTRTPLKDFEKDYGNEVPDVIGAGRFIYDWVLTPKLRDAIDARVHFAPAYHPRTVPARSRSGQVMQTW